MSQIPKKPGNLPVRKRLKPTVNLNVASRRRKDTKDTPSVTDVTADALTEPSKTKCHSNSVSIKENSASQNSSNGDQGMNSVSDSNVKERLNRTFESEKSFSSLATVVLHHENDNDGIDKALEGQSLSREISERSVTSSVSTILLQDASKSRETSKRSVTSSVSTILLDQDASKESIKNNLNQSIESLEEINEIDISNVTVNKSPRAIPCAVETIGKEQNKSRNLKDDMSDTDMSNRLRGSVSQQVLNNDRNNTDTLSHHSGNESKSETCETRTVLPQNEKNVDAESVIDDSVSSVSDNCSLTRSLDGSFPKCRRKVSEMAKRLSEARREFESRYCNKKPERNNLRMFDLIYYNPSTNPMKQISESPKEVVINSPPNETNSSLAVEEEVDNPEEEENVDEDNDNGIPAPRVKVGPNGEIVLDEQSLVIETTQSKKSKQEIANLTVVVDTGSNTTYHTYSKRKRMRSDWSVKETVRFYKALQTLGTDFSLMQTLFPSRTRVDLKSKFKKEERINGHLIEKALRFPSLFDLSELEKEPINEEKETHTKKKKVSRTKKRSLKSLGFDEEDSGPVLKKKKRKQGDKILQPKNHDKNTGKENLETHHKYSSDEEYQPPAEHLEKNEYSKGTMEHRSLRTRRNIKGNVPNYAALENKHDFLEAGVDLLELSGSEEENNPETENVVCRENVQLIDSSFDMNNVQPGSLVIVTTQCPDNPGYQICNVFMVQERSDTNSDNVVPPSTSDVTSTKSNTPDSSSVNTESLREPS